MFLTPAHQFRGVQRGCGVGYLHSSFYFDRMYTTQKVLIFNIFH